MKKLLPWACLGALLATFPFVTVQAEDPKADEDLFDNDTYGIKVRKPKGIASWKIVGQGAWDNYFKETDAVAFLLMKWKDDNLEGNRQKSPPLVTISAARYDASGKFKFGDKEVGASSAKTFAKAHFEDMTTKHYKNLKNVNNTEATNIGGKKYIEFSFYAESKLYGGAHYVRMLYIKEGKSLYIIDVSTAAGDEKKPDVAKEIQQVLASIQYYDPKK